MFSSVMLHACLIILLYFKDITLIHGNHESRQITQVRYVCYNDTLAHIF